MADGCGGIENTKLQKAVQCRSLVVSEFFDAFKYAVDHQIKPPVSVDEDSLPTYHISEVRHLWIADVQDATKEERERSVSHSDTFISDIRINNWSAPEVEGIQHGVHSIRAMAMPGKGYDEKGSLDTKYLSCFCDQCPIGQPGLACTLSSETGDWVSRSLKYKFHSATIDFYENLTVQQASTLNVTDLKYALKVFGLKPETSKDKKAVILQQLLKYLNQQMAEGIALRVDRAAILEEEAAENDNEDIDE